MTWRERLRHPLRSWTLRQKLLATLMSVVLLLGVLISGASVIALHSYLVSRLDDTLTAAANRVKQATGAEIASYQNPTLNDILGGPGQQVGTFGVLIVGSDVTGVYISANTDPQSGPYQSPKIKETPLSAAAKQTLRNLVPGKPSTVDLQGVLGEYRVEVLDVATVNGTRIQIATGLPLSEVHLTGSWLMWIALVATLGAVIIAAGIGLLIVRAMIRPLERLAMAAGAVTTLPLDRGEVSLNVRVPEKDTDPRTEVGRVGMAFNAMLGHVEGALESRQRSENKIRQFVSDASHELRTPLASIRGYSELTRRSPDALSPDMQRSLGRIESEALRMTLIVEDLLLLARLDEGREIKREPVDLTMLAINLLSDAHAAGPDHNWLLDLPEEPVEIIGDELRLHQVVANLLTNARVHTPAGTTVTLGVSVDDSTAIVTVSDNGEGIDPELQGRLFERFARGDSSRSRETGSTGLGLAIVRAIVEAHHGQISVASEPGHTVFTVRVPRVQAVVPPTVELQSAPAPLPHAQDGITASAEAELPNQIASTVPPVPLPPTTTVPEASPFSGPAADPTAEPSSPEASEASELGAETGVGAGTAPEVAQVGITSVDTPTTVPDTESTALDVASVEETHQSQ